MANWSAGELIARRRQALAGAVLLLAGLGLGGCSISLSDMPLIGSDDAKKETPAVNNVPAHLQEPLEAAERSKIQAELIAARDRQAQLQAQVAAANAAAAAAAPATTAAR